MSQDQPPTHPHAGWPAGGAASGGAPSGVPGGVPGAGPQGAWGVPGAGPQGAWGAPGAGPQGAWGVPGAGPQGAWGAPGVRYAGAPPWPWVPGGTGVEDVGRYAWTRFRVQPSPLVLGVLAWMGVIVVLTTVMVVVWGVTVVAGLAAQESGAAPTGPTVAMLSVVAGLYLAVLLVAMLLQAATARVALDVTAGRRVTVASFFRTERFGTVLLTAALVLVLTLLGTLLCYLPGLVLGFYAQFTLFFVLDKGLGPVEALRSSARLVQRNLQPAALVVLVALVANQVGGALVVGVLVTIPVTAIGQAYLYRRLLGEPVA